MEPWHGCSATRRADCARFDVARRLRTRCRAVAFAKDKLLPQDAHFCTLTLLMKSNLVLNMALFIMR